MSIVTLIEASPWLASTGAAQAVRLAGGGVRGYDHLGFSDWRAGVASTPRFKASVGFGQNGWTGGALPQTSGLRFAPADSALLTTLGGYHWIGAPITVKTGDDASAAPAWTTQITGTVAGLQVDNGAMVLTIADLGQALAVPIVTARFAGTGGAEGGSDALGQIKRRSWGRVFNVEGRVLDKTNNIYEFGDPNFPLQQFDAVKDIGRAGPITVVAWAGSVAATLTALIAAAPVQGGGVVAPSIACVKWWTQPILLTADIRGEVGAGYVETAPDIASRIAGVGGVTISNTAAMAALRTGAAGLHAGDESETIAMALDRLLLGVSLLWVLAPAGTITIREWTWAAPVETLRAEQLARREVFKPIWSRRIGYQRNEKIHAASEVSSILLDSTNAWTPLVPSNGNIAQTAAGTFTRVAATTAWGDSVGSAETFNSGAQVSFKLISNPATNDVCVGLDAVPSTTGSNANIDFGILVTASTATGRLNGVASGPSIAAAANDTFSVIYDGASVRFLKNGSAFHQVAAASGLSLGLVAALPTASETIGNLSFSAAGGIGASAFNIVNAANCLVTNNSAQKIGGSNNNWDSSVNSLESFTGGAYVSFRANSMLQFMVGLNSDPALNNSYTSIDFCIHANGGTMRFYENGVLAGVTDTYTTADVLSVSYTGAQVIYAKNGVAIRTISAAAGLKLYMDSSFYESSAKAADIVFGPIAGVNVVGLLTNEAHTVPTASDGTGGDFSGAVGTFKVYNGLVDVTTSSVFAEVSETGCTGTINTGTGAYAVTVMSTETATYRVSATYNGVTITKDFTLSKSKGGLASKTLSVISDRQTIAYDGAGVASPTTQTTTFTTNKQNTTGTVNWSITDANGVARTPTTTYLSAATGDSVTMTEAQFASARNGTSGVIITGSITDGTTFSDKISVVKVQAGANGTNGTNGTNGLNGASSFTLVAGGTATVTPTTITAASSGADWAGGASSLETYVGGAYASCRSTNAARAFYFGLDDVVTLVPGSLGNCFYLRSDANYEAIEDGVASGILGTYTTADVFTVKYTGNIVLFLKNGAVVRTRSWLTGVKVGFVSTFAPLAGAVNVAFGPVGRDAVVFYQDATPSSPVFGDTWITVTGRLFRRWDGSGWVQLLGDVAALSLITNAYIGALAVGSANIASGAITNAKIGNLEVDNAKIANLTVGTSKIASDAVTAPWYVDSSSTIVFASATKTECLSVSVTKAEASSMLEVHSQLQFFASDAIDGDYEYEVLSGVTVIASRTFSIRLDGNNSTYLPLSFEAYFSGIAAGSYTVKMYFTRTTANTVSSSGLRHMRVREFKK